MPHFGNITKKMSGEVDFISHIMWEELNIDRSRTTVSPTFTLTAVFTMIKVTSLAKVHLHCREVLPFPTTALINLIASNHSHTRCFLQVENDQIMVDLDEGRAYCCPSSDDLNSVGGSSDAPNLTPLSQRVDCHLPEQVTDKLLYKWVHNTALLRNFQCTIIHLEDMRPLYYRSGNNVFF